MLKLRSLTTKPKITMKLVFIFIISLFFFSCSNHHAEKEADAASLLLQDEQTDSFDKEYPKIVPDSSILFILDQIRDDSLIYVTDGNVVIVYKNENILSFWNKSKHYRMILGIDGSIFYAAESDEKDDLIGWLEDDDYEQSKLAKPSIIMGQPSSIKALQLWEKRKKAIVTGLIKSLKQNKKSETKRVSLFNLQISLKNVIIRLII